MINRKKKYISRLTFAAAITSILFSGCGAAQKELAQTDRAFYEKISYQTVTVQSGSLTPQTTISLSAQGYTRFSYGATNTELTLEKVNVAVGDHVKKGDILVAFKSGEIQKKIEDYSGQISQNKQKLSRYQITSSEDGTITAMDNSLLAGVFEPGSNLITEISGNGNYEADRPEGYDFNVGDVYTATASDIEFELKVKEVDDKKLVFEPVSDMSAVSDAQIFSMEVTCPAIENAVYVQKDAVHEKDGRYFVYTLDENGYRQAVWISVADQVGDYRIITEGLKSGDEVVLQ